MKSENRSSQDWTARFTLAQLTAILFFVSAFCAAVLLAQLAGGEFSGIGGVLTGASLAGAVKLWTVWQRMRAQRETWFSLD